MIATASQACNLLPWSKARSISTSRCNYIDSASAGSLSTFESWRSEFGSILDIGKYAADRSCRPLRRRHAHFFSEASGDGQPQASGSIATVESFASCKHSIPPILDRNPQLSRVLQATTRMTRAKEAPKNDESSRTFSRRHLAFTAVALYPLPLFFNANGNNARAEEMELVEGDLPVLPSSSSTSSPSSSSSNGGTSGGNVIDEMRSLFDPNEVTKSGRSLPKAYVRSSREVIAALRESLLAPDGDLAELKRRTDRARDAIREFLSVWRSSSSVVSEVSYVSINKALKDLGEFYAKKGPRATMPAEIRDKILIQLDVADAAL